MFKQLLYSRMHQKALILASICFILDQISKSLAVNKLSTGSIYIYPYLDLNLVYNPGISYGLFPTNSTIGLYTLIFITGLITFCLLCAMLKSQEKFYIYSIGLIIGGALGNIYDRIHRGAVVDFISLHNETMYWYIFNLADVFVTVGAILAILHVFRSTK